MLLSVAYENAHFHLHTSYAHSNESIRIILAGSNPQPFGSKQTMEFQSFYAF